MGFIARCPDLPPELAVIAGRALRRSPGLLGQAAVLLGDLLDLVGCLAEFSRIKANESQLGHLPEALPGVSPAPTGPHRRCPIVRP